MAKWKRVKDQNVRHVWVCEDKNCKCQDKVYPAFYANGTPICECGQDMVYLYTEVRQ